MRAEPGVWVFIFDLVLPEGNHYQSLSPPSGDRCWETEVHFI